MRLSCEVARRTIWPNSGPVGASPEVFAARNHVETCPSCGAFLREMEGVARTIRDHAPRPTAPLELRGRMFENIANRRAAHGRRFRLRIIAGAALAVAGALVIWLTPLLRRPDPIARSGIVSALADDHSRSVRGEGIRSPDAAAVSAWIRARLPFAVDVPVFDDAKLRSARLGIVTGHQAAVIEYDLQGRTVSYFVFDAGPNERNEPVGQLSHATDRGFQIVIWREPDLTHALVGAVPQSRLDELARLCIAQSRTMMTVDDGTDRDNHEFLWRLRWRDHEA
ncbi:MAG: hypothetical protein WD802_10840 [Gemmatimonadaceae bacterium]